MENVSQDKTKTYKQLTVQQRRVVTTVLDHEAPIYHFDLIDRLCGTKRTGDRNKRVGISNRIKYLVEQNVLERRGKMYTLSESFIKQELNSQ